MIKADQGTVIMKGTPIDLLAELCTVLKSARKNFGDKYVDFMVEQSKVLSEESKKEAGKKEKVVKDFLDLISNKGEK
nr:MAG TPA: hypothetical protein [Bacteriophage sp.]